MKKLKGLPDLDDPSALTGLVQRLREGIYITNRAGEILDANPAFLEMFGIASLDELAEYSAQDLVVDPVVRKRERAILEADGVVRDFELTLRRPDGTTCTVLDTAYTLEQSDDDAIYVGMLIDISARKALERRLREQAVRDALTGCFNRRYLRSLSAEIDDSEADWGTVVVDIDHFKRYNDEHGHQAGDEILVKTSRFLAGEIRAEDAVIRYGGDEFMLFLHDADLSTTETIGARLRDAGPRCAPVPFSIGWASRRGGESLEKTIGRADQNLIRVRFEVRGRSFERRSTGG